MSATPLAQRPLLEHSTRLPLAQLHPGNFAFVMASGILSSAFEQLGYAWASDGLFAVALCSWLILLGLSSLRVLRHPGAVRADLLNPAMVFGFFTLVAASNIVGQLLLARALVPWAIACWLLAFVAWCLLLYLAFSVLTFLSHEHNVGMYAVASLRLGLAADVPPLQWISQLMVWFASAAWVVVAVGLAKRLVRGR